MFVRSLSVVCLAGITLAPGVAGANPARPGRWGVGVHGAAVGLEAAEGSEVTTESQLGGLGIHGRFRASRRWEVEVSAARLRGQRKSGTLSRDLNTLTVSALFHINPHRRTLWSVIAGFGGGVNHVEFTPGGGKAMAPQTAELHHGSGHLGVAVARRYGHLDLSAQVQVVGMSRNDEEGDGPAFAGRDVPTPREEGGMRASLSATYYFF